MKTIILLTSFLLLFSCNKKKKDDSVALSSADKANINTAIDAMVGTYLTNMGSCVDISGTGAGPWLKITGDLEDSTTANTFVATLTITSYSAGTCLDGVRILSIYQKNEVEITKVKSFDDSTTPISFLFDTTAVSTESKGTSYNGSAASLNSDTYCDLTTWVDDEEIDLSNGCSDWDWPALENSTGYDILGTVTGDGSLSFAFGDATTDPTLDGTTKAKRPINLDESFYLNKQ